MNGRSGDSPFQVLLAAINRLAHEVNLPLGTAVELFRALDAYTQQQVAGATGGLQAEIDRLRGELDEATGQ